LAAFGIDVVDVRIRRTDLPPENQRAIFNRMRAERERQAKQYRAEGQEMAAKIRAQADKERAVILSEAQKQAQIIRGEGEAEATTIYAKALEEAPSFYEFKRSLEAYEKSLKENTRVIMTPNSPFLKHFR
jgi:membrane protease subunit HflC